MSIHTCIVVNESLKNLVFDWSQIQVRELAISIVEEMINRGPTTIAEACGSSMDSATTGIPWVMVNGTPVVHNGEFGMMYFPDARSVNKRGKAMFGDSINSGGGI